MLHKYDMLLFLNTYSGPEKTPVDVRSVSDWRVKAIKNIKVLYLTRSNLDVWNRLVKWSKSSRKMTPIEFKIAIGNWPTM